MFLTYRPTGDSVFLGKRMAYGWYGVPENLPELILKLFNKSERDGIGFSQDDFCISMESGENQPFVLDDFQYGDLEDDGIRKLIIPEDVPYGKPELI